MKWLVIYHEEGDDKWFVGEYDDHEEASAAYEKIYIQGQVGQPDVKIFAKLVDKVAV